MRVVLPRWGGETIHADRVLLAMLVGSLAMNVYLGVSRTKMTAARVADQGQVLRSGTQAPAFEGQDLNGASLSLRYEADTRDTLLYVFSPTCHWCERNAQNINTIVKARTDLRVVGVALSGTAAELRESRVPFDVIVRPTRATIKAYGLGATPMTILISSQGKVIKTWPGAYAGELAADVPKV